MAVSTPWPRRGLYLITPEAADTERLLERVLPRIAPVALDNLLHAAHVVDGIVKGLRQPDWPADGWPALHRLALMLCQECSLKPQAMPRKIAI